MFLAYLLLITGLTISAVAIYYSVVGLTAIFSAAVIPIVVMGSALEVAKLVCASWLKANWARAPFLLRTYMAIAVAVLMLITSMGIFGFLSKAHNDQNLVSGDVQSKIAVYDEKIKTAKENIDANRKILKQMDESVDQTMGRSNDEKGADKAVALRKSQAKERARLLADIQTEQKTISQLNDEAAPIRAEVRKVEAEVGPIKYIAKFIYGDNGADENMLEKAVTWIIITIVIVFDPLAVIMLLAAQMTFAWHRQGHDPLAEETPPVFVADVGEPPTEEEKGVSWRYLSEDQYGSNHPANTEGDQVVAEQAATVPYQFVEEHHEPDYPEPENKAEMDMIIDQDGNVTDLDRWNRMIEEAEREVAKLEEHVDSLQDRVARGESYITTDGAEILLGGDVERPGDYITPPDESESKKKTYMTKDQQGQTILKNKH